MTPRLTAEQRDAVDEHDGCVAFEDASGKCVLMSIEAFRQMMGSGTDRALRESVAALRRSDAQSARVRRGPRPRHSARSHDAKP
jgi:hypothetical protein